MTFEVPDHQDTVNDFLQHYGVKGMRWGKRKAAPRAEGYSERDQRIDVNTHGRGGSKRINKSIEKGESLKTARNIETARRKQRRQNAIALTLTGAYALSVFAPEIMGATNNHVNNAVMRKKAANGERARQQAFSDRMGIPNYSTIVR